MKVIPAILRFLALAATLFFLPSSLFGQDDSYEFDTDEDFYYIQFNEGDGTPIKDLIILCQDVTGYPIQFQEAEVSDQKIYIIGKQKIRKSRQGFFEYFQSVMISYEFICAPYGPEKEPFFITVRRMTPARAGAGVVLTGYVGPKAFQVLMAAGVRVGQNLDGRSVAEALEAYKQGRVEMADRPNRQGHGR